MERLTKRDLFDGAIELTKEIWEPIAPYDEVMEALDKLAAYEDTGLESEEIEKASKVIVSTLNFAANSVPNMLVGRLKEIIRAEGEGRLMVLPCKVGTPIYWINFNQHDGYWIELGEFHLQDIGVFGKTVFRTREEAEKALEKMNDAASRC